MIVYWVAAAEALFYLSAVPLCVAVCVRAGDGVSFGAGIAAFDAGRAYRRTLRRKGNAPTRRRRGGRRNVRMLGLLRRVSIERLELSGAVALGDAAGTALACGGIRALAAALRSRVPIVRVCVRPDFSHSGLSIELRGMIQVRLGQIIAAAARSGLQNMYGRIAQWIRDRSKA